MRRFLLLLLVLLAAIPLSARRRSVRHPAPRRVAAQPVVYVVEVRSFSDSDGDGAGDLRGLMSRLDYLHNLGVDVLLLLAPIESTDFGTTYGFTPLDFESIERDFGTNEDFDLLVAAAQSRGMRVAIDLILNHTSSVHPWKVQSDAWYIYADGAYPNWPAFDGSTDSSWHPVNATNTRWVYGLFGGGRPDLNYTVPAVREEMKRIAASWLARGVAGFRFPKAQFLIETGPGAGQIDTPETHAFLRELADAMRGVRPDVLLIGDSRQIDTPVLATYFADLPQNFDYPIAIAARETLASRNADPLAAKLREVARIVPAGATLSPFLSHFDRTRLATLLDSDPARMRLAASLLLTLPGVPFLYYGEEIGMPSGEVTVVFHGLPNDAARGPMRWSDVDAQTNDASSLLSRYRTLMLTEEPANHVSAKRIDATTWGLLLLMTGILMLLPRHTVPEGAWLILAGAILLGASAVRYAKKLRVSAFVIALGVLAIAAGGSAIAGVELPLFAAFLVLLGASIMFRSWFVHGET